MSLIKRNPKYFIDKILNVMYEQKTTPADAEHPHSIYGASGAKRMRLCIGSVKFIEKCKAEGKIAETEDTKDSSEGTEAHGYGDNVLTSKIPIQEVPEDFRLHLEGYINHCKMLSEKALAKGGRVFNEATVPLYYRPQDIGTLDFATITPNITNIAGKLTNVSRIDFVDLKYGKGVPVAAKLNDQLIIYLLSLVEMLEIDEMEEFHDETPVSLAIYQPRHFSFNGEADVWHTTLRELKDYGIDIEADYHRAKNAKGVESELNPVDEACQFCPAKGICSARAKKNLNELVDFDDETCPTVKHNSSDTLTAQQKAFIINNGASMKKTIDDIEKQERSRIEQGGELELVKLVKGNLTPKKWVDEKAADTFLKSQLSVDERYQPRKLITAPQAFGKLKTRKEELSTIAKAKLGLLDEEAAKKSKTECLFHRSVGAPQLVPIEDERPALDFTPAEEEFEVEPNTGDDELDALM